MQHCFIVDDSEIVRKYARLIFESLAFRVSEADSASAALARLSMESPDYILVDWRIPGSNMHDFIAAVRKLPLPKRPYIVYVATENDTQDVQRALKLGADNFILKPFNRDIIEMKLHEIRVAA